MKKKVLQIIIIISCLFTPFFKSHSQKSYAKTIVSKLASANFNGRGYVQNGDKKAAKFIKEEFQKLGLKSIGKSYYQKFTTSTNTFPNNLSLKINGNPLEPGIDYLVDPGSPSVKGKFKCVTLQLNDLLDRNRFIKKMNTAREKIILINTFKINTFSSADQQQITEVVNFLKYSKNHPAKGLIVFSDKKLTWSASQTQNTKISFTCNKNIDTHNIQNVDINIKSKYYKKYTTQNCIGIIEGKSDSTIVISAHYDHLGQMGKETYFPGANDNASGIALLLSIAKEITHQNKKPKHSIVFIAFGGEEIGLMGSKYFVNHPTVDLSKIIFLLNFDLAGTGDEGIKIVNGTIYKEAFSRLKKINKQNQLLTQVLARGKACNSDHCNFDQKNIPCFYSYTLGGIKAYHDVHDKAATLPLTEFDDYLTLMLRFIKSFE